MDAAIATAVTLTVVQPASNHVGGDLFAPVWDGRQSARAERVRAGTRVECHLKGPRPYLLVEKTVPPVQPPPMVTLSMIIEAIRGAGPAELITSIGLDEKIMRLALETDSPHIGLCIPSGDGKALALDTRVPAPSGWTTMGEIKAGDVVYDETGAPCKVTDAWPVRHGRPCYEVEFSDGSIIVADAEHQWEVDSEASRNTIRPSRPAPKHPRSGTEVITTEVMAATLRTRRGAANYSVRVAGPLQCPDADLPVPPYTLGAWLGDGTTRTAGFTTIDPEIITEIEREGMRVTDGYGPCYYLIRLPAPEPFAEQPCAVCGSPFTPKTSPQRTCGKSCGMRSRAILPPPSPAICPDCGQSFHGGPRGLCQECWEDHGTVQACLRSIGVLGNKHIPAVYLRASEPQRRALLAGLLDTDGYCAKAGRIEYYSTCEQLARDVYHLVATLGYKASLRSKTARLHGKDCGTVWTVVLTTADKVFRLSRKASRQVTKMSATSGRRYVTAIRPVASVPVRCIAVDSPSHLYLAGESCIPTHNSVFAQLIAGQLLYKGGICLIIDHKLFSHPWALKGMPNVVYAGTEEEIHLALLWLAQEIKDRKQAARNSIDMRGRVHADVGPRLLVVGEELNNTVNKLKQYWKSIGGVGMKTNTQGGIQILTGKGAELCQVGFLDPDAEELPEARKLALAGTVTKFTRVVIRSAIPAAPPAAAAIPGLPQLEAAPIQDAKPDPGSFLASWRQAWQEGLIDADSPGAVRKQMQREKFAPDGYDGQAHLYSRARLHERLQTRRNRGRRNDP